MTTSEIIARKALEIEHLSAQLRPIVIARLIWLLPNHGVGISIQSLVKKL